MNEQEVVALVTAGAQVVGVLGPLALSLATKIKHALELTGDVSVNLKALGDEAIASDQETMKVIQDWRASVGLPPIA